MTESKRPTWQEIVDRKVAMAKERGARVMRINSPLGSVMFNVLRQFDQAYAHFKGRLGEPNGISHEEGERLMSEAREIAITFSNFTKRLSRRVGFRYYVPDELKTMIEHQKQQYESGDNHKQNTDVKAA